MYLSLFPFAETACVNLDRMKFMQVLEIQFFIFVSTGSFSSHVLINF